MSSQIFVDFKPAELHDTSSGTLIVFYVKNPLTGLLERQRIKLNHIHDKKERMKYGRLKVQQINKQLYEGWNPVVEKSGFSKIVTIEEAVRLYQKSYAGIRPDSLRSYDSMMKSFLNFCTLYNMADKPIYEFGRTMAQQYMLHVEERDISAKTYNNYVRFMGQFLNFCVDKGLAKDNPFQSIKLRRVDEKKRTIIPPEVREKILDYLVREKMDGFRLICLLTSNLYEWKARRLRRNAQMKRKSLPWIAPCNHLYCFSTIFVASRKWCFFMLQCCNPKNNTKNCSFFLSV